MSKEKFDYFINGEKGKYEVVIGLEVHAQVLSNSKLFSGSSTKFGADPNKQVSLIDSAFPGMLPVINEECVKQAVRTGLGLNAKINNYSVFDRKNYFYADLPQGYQISQYKNPIVGEGKVLLDMPYGSKEIGIERLHLEQDAGKSIHDMDPSSTYVDLNRSGIALMEIVSKPHLRSPDEVNAYIKKLRTIMRYLGTCDGNMQEGSLRADVNVSVRKVGDKNFGTRCEIKNVNSIKFMQMAIEYEANRQVELLEDGSNIILGDSLAYELNVAIGDSVNLLNIDQSNPLIGVPRVVAFKVVGIFSVGSEVDQNYALISSNSFLKLIKPKNSVGLELKVQNVLEARNIGRAIIEKLDTTNYIKMTSWDQSYGGLFRAVQLEKIMVSLLMSLILLVAILSLLISVIN